LVAPTKWKDFHLGDPESCSLFNDPVSVHPEWFTVWLLPEKVGIEQEEKPKGPPPKRFTMKFLREEETAAEKEEMERHIISLKKKGLRPPPEESILKIDPRHCVSQTQWRECVRREFDIAELSLDIRTLYAQVVGGKRVSSFGQGLPLGWTTVQDSSDIFKFQVQMKLKVTSEGAGSSWEWQGAPPSLLVDRGREELKHI
jgi:hypothetical protein